MSVRYVSCTKEDQPGATEFGVLCAVSIGDIQDAGINEFAESRTPLSFLAPTLRRGSNR